MRAEVGAGARPAGVSLLPIVVGLVFAAYPALVFFGLDGLGVRTLALLLLCLMVPVLVLALRRGGAAAGVLLLAPLLTVAALGASALLDDATWLFAEPVVISLVMLCVFGSTLRPGVRPMIERFARLQEPALSEPKQRWCRTWTWIWCGFFVVNASAAGVLAAAAPLSWWASYTTTGAYLLMGVLFATEWTLRRRRFGHG